MQYSLPGSDDRNRDRYLGVSPIYGHGELVEEFAWVVGNSFCHRDGLIEKGRGWLIGCRFVIWLLVRFFGLDWLLGCRLVVSVFRCRFAAWLWACCRFAAWTYVGAKICLAP